MNIRPRRDEDNPALVAIWLDAVRATHAFLSEADIQYYLPMVRDEYLPALDVRVASDPSGEPRGFIGLSDCKIEMLFVAPSHHGRGIGKSLLAHAAALKGELAVDVNEQNPEARAFYRRCGFTEVGRSDLDGAGRPFPLIHMVKAA